jgi:hypothetical protein
VRFLVRLRRHQVLYETDDCHQNNAPDAATGHISNHAESAADINTQRTQNRLEYLATDTATDNPSYAVTDSAQTEILEQGTADIAANSAQHELYNQAHIQFHIAPPVISPCLKT